MEDSLGPNKRALLVGKSRLQSPEPRSSAVAILGRAPAFALGLGLHETVTAAPSLHQPGGLEVPLGQHDLCGCGAPGRPFVTIHGADVRLCLSCFLREAREGRAPRATRSRLDSEGQGR